MNPRKILVAQGGGPTAVINQSLVGVVLEARRHRGVEFVYGARHGVRGIVNEDLVDLTQETSHNLELVAATPAAAPATRAVAIDPVLQRARVIVLERERRQLARTEWGFVEQHAHEGLRMNVSAGANVGSWRLRVTSSRCAAPLRRTASASLPGRFRRPLTNRLAGSPNRLRVVDV